MFTIKLGRAFTLVELMLVLAIIGLLMMMLIPEFTAIAVAVKKAETSNRISMLHQAVLQYQQVYSRHPPSASPNMRSTVANEACYPPYHYPGVMEHYPNYADGTVANYLFGDYGDYLPAFKVPFGGKYLAYFMLGPWGDGWHRPTTTSNTDLNYRNRFISAEWDFPEALRKFLDNSPVHIGLLAPEDYQLPKPDDEGTSYRSSPCFKDAFGRQSYCGGYIGYIAAIPGKDTSERRFDLSNTSFSCNALASVFITDCRSHPSWPGDDKGPEHLQKILRQSPYDFMIISPGPNGKYGYRVYTKKFTSYGRFLTYKGWWADLQAGIIDDMANFPIN